MRRLLIPAALCLAAVVTGCGHRSSAEIATADPAGTKRYANVHPASVVVTEDDITDRRYVSLGDISVTVSKNTIFDSDPTNAQAKQKLREAAGEMGANAVVFARYGTVGISFWSWGTLEAKGRAVRFVN